jgi:hypothetical protein
MEAKTLIPFPQLIKVVKSLTPSQKAKLRKELNEDLPVKRKEEFIKLLLNGPVYGKKDIKIIEANRKSIAKWRTKS